MSEASAPHAERFQDLARQAYAARLGIWIFLGSELLLFAGLFALYGSYRVHYPDAFGWGVNHNARELGTLNTAILIASSYCVATSVHQIRKGRPTMAAGLLVLTLVFGSAFLAVKGYEYAGHFRDGVYPGGHGGFFAGKPDGLKAFYTLYFLMTGLHGIHVVVGMGVLSSLAWRIRRGDLAIARTHPLEIGALYWHLIDVVWIFLWPIFYLTPGAAG